MSYIKLIVERLAHCPEDQLTQSDPQDIGFDLRAAEDMIILPVSQLPVQRPADGSLYVEEKPTYQTQFIKTGVKVQAEARTAILILPRSGMASKSLITLRNAPGLVDSPGYTGEILISALNLGSEPYIVRRGDRIAQLVIIPLPQVQLVEGTVQATSRGAGGFGSTGIA